MKMEVDQLNNSICDESPVDDCNVFVKYLPCDYTEKELYKLFEPYGSIVNTKVMVNIKTGNSLGYGFVRFSDANFAQEAIKNMNRVQIGYKTLLCKLSKPSTTVNLVAADTTSEVENPGDPTSTLYVRILSPTVTDLMLKQTFSQYGDVIESQVLIDSISGKSKRAGLIRFSSLQNSIKAFNAMNGSLLLGETPLVIKYAPNSTKVNKTTITNIINASGIGAGSSSPSTSPYISSANNANNISLNSSTGSTASSASSGLATPSLQAQQAYIQPFLLNGPSSPGSSSSTSPNSSFHICTYTPHHQAIQYIPYHEQYQAQYYADQYQGYASAAYHTPAQIFATSGSNGETILLNPTTTTYYHHHHHPDYYYQISYPPTTTPIYTTSSPSTSPSSPSLSPQSSPRSHYYQESAVQPILICTFKGSIEYSNLLSIFSKYGELKSINININPNNNKNKCFINYNLMENAVVAQQQLDKCKVGQSLIRVKFLNKKQL